MKHDTLMAIRESKIQAEEIDDQLSTFIEYSDTYINNAVPKHFVNNTAMTTDEQLDMFILAREARIWWSLYDISYSYWKSNPKTIDNKTRETLRSLA